MEKNPSNAPFSPIAKKDVDREIMLFVAKFVGIKVAIALAVHFLTRYLNKRYGA